MEDIENRVEQARYSDNLASLLERLEGQEVLRCCYESNYQGEVDIDVLLKDGRVFSYQYYYGSCSGCDDWEARNLTDIQIEGEMLKECTLFDNKTDYFKWRMKVKTNA